MVAYTLTQDIKSTTICFGLTKIYRKILFCYMNHGKESIFMLSEFKKFALKGNVLDLAVGVIIGGALVKL